MRKIKMLLMAAFTIMSVSLFAQDPTPKPEKMAKEKKEKASYTCPMHADEVSDKPGKCSKCNMDMVKAKKEKKQYSCPMHPEEVSDKPGKCSKCNMDLVKMKKDKKEYSCPMHPDEASDKPGKCAKCGMDMKKKDDHSGHNH